MGTLWQRNAKTRILTKDTKEERKGNGGDEACVQRVIGVFVLPAPGSQTGSELRCCEPPGKRVKRGLPGARGRVSWDPVVADPPIRGVQSKPALQGTGVPGVRQARSVAKISTECANTGC